MEEKVTLEAVEELFDFLQGDCPKNIKIKHMPKLSEKEAFAVIYYLQEQMQLIPDIYEMCDKCFRIYDSNYEGTVVADERFCEDCYYDGLHQEKYHEYQLRQMIKQKLSVRALFEKLEQFRQEQTTEFDLMELFEKWQKEANDMWVLEDDDWESDYEEIETGIQEEDGLSEYEKYQLTWLIENEYSLDDIFSLLSDVMDSDGYEDDDKNIMNLYEIWEDEIGLSHSVWVCEYQWNTTDELEDKTSAYLNIVAELQDAVKEGYLSRDEKNPNNVLVYRAKGETNEEGWYSENILAVASELLEDENNYQDFKKAIEDAKNSDETPAMTMPVANGILRATMSLDENYPGINIEYIANDDNGEDLSYPRVLVENPECGKEIRCLIWNDPQEEDYTENIILKTLTEVKK